MLMVHSAMAAMTGAGSDDEYARFLAHITALATDGERAWGGQSPTGRYITTASSPTGIMYGSSWSSAFFSAAAVARFIQHGLPSEAVFSDQVASGRKIYFVTVYAGTFTSLTGQNRNGYLSLSAVEDEGLDSLYCNRILYWFDGAAWEVTPSTGAGPTPYTGHLA